MNGNKIIGYRKMSIAVATISALIWKPPADFGIAVIVGIIAIVGITAQAWLDRKGNSNK